MYHPSRGGVRGGRDQFNWEDVKTDKHRENYLGHSVKAPVGRWQKGKDLNWYAKDKKTLLEEELARKDEIKRIKEDEEQAMRELLGLAPKREKRFQGNRLDKHETAELLRKGKAEEELVPDYAQGERVQGLGFAPAPRHYSSNDKETFEMKSTLPERVPPPRVREQEEHNPSPSKEDDNHSDDRDAKLKRKQEKREAKEKRKEEKRAAKEKRKHSESRSDRSDRKHARERY